MIIRKAFQFHLRPTKKQAKALQIQLDECRWLYNQLLEQRKLSHEELDIGLNKYQQSMFLPELKIERPSLTLVHSQVLQNVVDRLDKAFTSFFRRYKNGETPGFPRFRSLHRYNSICYPQSGFSLVGSELKLSKIGSIRLKLHRPVSGTIKSCTIRKTASGSWLVSLSCEVETMPLQSNNSSVGIDVGIENFAVLTNGEAIANPKFFKKEEKILAKAQQKFSKKEKGSIERKKCGKIVAKIHERISNKRKDFCHKESKKIVDKYQHICVEDLNIKKMVEGSFLAKSITDASWGMFLQFLTYKAADAGRKLGLVNPAYTSQTCSRCQHIEEKMLSERKHSCSQCGYQTTRDFNAAQNILALGLDGLGAIPRSLRL
jgi:putative transposase